MDEKAKMEAVRDVFGRLVDARSTDGKLTLSDEEIIGNCFVFMFAGHETTAGTLAAAMGLLATHPEAQERVYHSIKKVLGDREPTFDDFDSLEEVLACFYEALRMFPAAFLMLRETFRDAVLPLSHIDEPTTVENVPFSKNTVFVVDFFGLFYDPALFPDPERFDPTRWTKTKSTVSPEKATTKATQADEVSSTTAGASSLEGFVGFSFGPRTCLGHKFAKVEAVAFLTLLMREWRIEPVLEGGESREEWRSRVLEPRIDLTIKFADMPLKLIRREIEG